MLSRLQRLRSPFKRAISYNTSFKWEQVPHGPRDPILGLTEMYNADTNPNKVNVGVGAYRDDDGKPYILPSVRAAERRLAEKGIHHEYAPIDGLKPYVDCALQFLYGDDCAPLHDGTVAGVQALSGTGACRLFGEFVRRFIGDGTAIHLPSPTWGNHIPIFKDAGLDVKSYRYYNADTIGLDFEGMMEDVHQAPEGSVFLLHACAHNPTGVDPTMDQWRELSNAFSSKGHLAFFDSAYQGFASGDKDADAAAVRMFVENGHNIFVAQSFAKNFGLYGERVGALSGVFGDSDTAERVRSQLKILIRPMYSSPPLQGARLVAEIWNDDELRSMWSDDCKRMADRIAVMRKQLRESLEAKGSSHDWSHITSQIGMFCFSGLTGEQCDRLTKEFNIYLTRNGRISMAGVTSKNVDYLADAIHAVTS